MDKVKSLTTLDSYNHHGTSHRVTNFPELSTDCSLLPRNTRGDAGMCAAAESVWEEAATMSYPRLTCLYRKMKYGQNHTEMQSTKTGISSRTRSYWTSDAVHPSSACLQPLLSLPPLSGLE